jgi:hypothetical protein
LHDPVDGAAGQLPGLPPPSRPPIELAVTAASPLVLALRGYPAYHGGEQRPTEAGSRARRSALTRATAAVKLSCAGAARRVWTLSERRWHRLWHVPSSEGKPTTGV